jgi:hypothetical protein
LEFDPVTKAAHYNQGGIECLAAMEASMTPDEFLGFLKGSIIKYVWRWRDKGKGAEDLGKAQFYLGMLQERVKKREDAALLARLPILGTTGPVTDMFLHPGRLMNGVGQAT